MALIQQLGIKNKEGPGDYRPTRALLSNKCRPQWISMQHEQHWRWMFNGAILCCTNHMTDQRQLLSPSAHNCMPMIGRSRSSIIYKSQTGVQFYWHDHHVKQACRCRVHCRYCNEQQLLLASSQTIIWRQFSPVRLHLIRGLSMINKTIAMQNLHLMVITCSIQRWCKPILQQNAPPATWCSVNARAALKISSRKIVKCIVCHPETYVWCHWAVASSTSLNTTFRIPCRSIWSAEGKPWDVVVVVDRFDVVLRVCSLMRMRFYARYSWTGGFENKWKCTASSPREPGGT